MAEAVDVVMETLQTLDNDVVARRTFEGLPSLANPKYDLYLEPGPVAEEYNTDPDAVDCFRDRMIRYLEGNHSALDLAATFDLPLEFVHDYLTAFADAGLAELEQPD
jgi:hypothetical protein